MQTDISLDNLGVKLREHKIITEAQLFHAIARQKLKGGYLSQHLIELNYIRDIDLTAYISCHYGYPYLPLDSYHISKNALDTLDVDTIRTYCVLPIDEHNKLLSIVMADPLNRGVIELLKNMTKNKIIVFVSTKTEIKRAFEKNFAAPLENTDLDKTTYRQLRDDTVYSDVFPLDKQQSRRFFKRVSVNAIAESYSQPSLCGKIINLSFNGILFLSNIYLQQGTQIPLNIHLEKGKTILAVAEIIRCETPKTELAESQTYEIGAIFNFLSHKDLKVLADFLLERIKKASKKDILQKIQEKTENMNHRIL